MESRHVEQRDGVYYVAGTRISLDSIIYAFQEGCSPESIREDFDGLTLAHVYGAIAYYLDHEAEMKAYLAKHREEWSELERKGTPPSADLRARIERARRSVLHPRR